MRPSKDIQADLDALNRKRRAIDKQIQDRRAELNELNAKVSPLEREFQAAIATEQQAAIAAQTKH